MANDEFSYFTTTRSVLTLPSTTSSYLLERWPRVRSVVTHHFVRTNCVVVIYTHVLFFQTVLSPQWLVQMATTLDKSQPLELLEFKFIIYLYFFFIFFIISHIITTYSMQYVVQQQQQYGGDRRRRRRSDRCLNTHY